MCSEDLSQYVRSSLGDASMFPLKCPLHHEGCPHTVSPQTARLFLNKEELGRFQEHQDRALFGDGVRCVHCRFFIVMQADLVSGASKIYLTACPRCTKVFCMQCRKASHSGTGGVCPVDVHDASLLQWKKQCGAQQCPSCRKVIEKEDEASCNHMVHKSSDCIPCCKERTDFCCESLYID
jgi:hypothetical protein